MVVTSLGKYVSGKWSNTTVMKIEERQDDPILTRILPLTHR